MKKISKWLERFQPVTAYNSSYYLESFLVAAISTVLAIRLLLNLTGYPQVGGGSLHIAHVLPGGLLMLTAVVVQSTFLGDKPRSAAAIIGGIGFGFFIDEIGKFLTSDNDYFFRPTALIIYVMFLGLWFLFRELQQRRDVTYRAKIANILELLQEGVIFGFNRQEIAQLQRYASSLSSNETATRPLLALVSEIQDEARRDQPSLYVRFSAWVGDFYKALVRQPFFAPTLYSVFLVAAILSLFSLVDFLTDWLGGATLIDFDSAAHRAQLGQLLGGLLYALLVAVSFARLRSSRLLAYRTFKTALLVNIFITQFFAFYHLQFAAAIGLIYNLVLLSLVNYGITLEKHLFTKTGKDLARPSLNS